MKQLTYWTGLRIWRDRKNRVLLILFLVFFASFSLIYRQQNLFNPWTQMDEAYQDELQIYRLIPQQHFESELGREVQQRLGNNSVSLSVQRYWLKQEEEEKADDLLLIPDYAEVGQQLVENNLFLHEATDFESHDLLVEEYLPPLHEVHEQQRFFDALNESDLSVEWNFFSSAQVLKAEIELLAGILLFLLIALLANDHFTKDHDKHWSVTHGLPVPWKRKWRLRSMYLFGLFWGVALVGMVMSYFVGTFADTSGSLNYPTAIYLESGLHYIPLWQYLGIVLVLSMLLSYVLILLTTGLSWFIKNAYLTILIVAGLYLVPRLWEIIPAFSSWQPSLYLNLFEVMNGSMADMTGLSSVVWWKAGIIYLLMIVVLEFVFDRVFSRIPTETSGLKRRVLA